MITSPHDLLPIKNPFEYEPDEDFFYTNVIKPLVPDVLRMMNNGILLDWDKVTELTNTVSNVLEVNHKALHSNPHIIKYLEKVKEELIEEKFKEQSDKFKTVEDCIVPYKDGMLHRTYLVNTYLRDKGHDEYISDKWSVADLKKLNTIINSEVISNILDKKWLLLNDWMDLAMYKLAEDKCNIYNKERLAPVERFRQSLDDLTFNVNSSKQKNGLFDLLNIDTLNKTKTGAKQINREELERLQVELTILSKDENINLDELNLVKDIIDIMIDDSNASIINNNFIPAFNKFSINSVLFGNFKLFGAKSFRLTSNSPNLLNLPSNGNKFAKTVKQCFIAPKDFIIYAVDLSSLEDRVIANLSLDENKCNIFLKNLDS